MEIINKVNKHIQASDKSMRAFARELRHYIDSDLKEESFYQRHYSFLKKEFASITDEELRAYKSWLAVEKDPHRVGGAGHRIKEGNMTKKIDEMKKWLSSGIFNPTRARKMSKSIKDMLSDLIEALEN